ncbi:hypothetical protein DBV15_07319 [Temnothorax longispinosus]|uniref:Uncharacterized protein n=1 Tax=Temnothorax longispinosus TaxID=300112 RepID=A0A4S2KMN1_9HYME|nr:hypothetical protein DBV15_07319 [Temnothorax longispinosus]
MKKKCRKMGEALNGAFPSSDSYEKNNALLYTKKRYFVSKIVDLLSYLIAICHFINTDLSRSISCASESKKITCDFIMYRISLIFVSHVLAKVLLTLNAIDLFVLFMFYEVIGLEF